MEGPQFRRQRKARINKASAIALTLAVLFPLGGFIWSRGRGHHTAAQSPTSASHNPGAPNMLQFRPVRAVAPPVIGVPPTPALTCWADACTRAQLDPAAEVVLQGKGGVSDTIYTLGPSIADGRNVAYAKLTSPTDSVDSWIVDLRLDDSGTARLAAATAYAAGAASPLDQIAVVWNGMVISSPAVQTQIIDGQMQLALDTQTEASDLLTGLGAPPMPSSTPSPGPIGQDIGLPARWCELSKLGGLNLLGNGTKGTAWTGYAVNKKGNCPSDPKWRVAVDVTGDGLADAQSGPIEMCRDTGCALLGATDLDADGDQEFVIRTQVTIIVDHEYFSVRKRDGGGYSLDPILVATPGHPTAGIKPGTPLLTTASGDAGYDSWMRCEGYPTSPILVWTFDSFTLDSGPTHWHETKLQLREVGNGPPKFYVVATNDFTIPWAKDPGLIRSTKPACGLDFNIWVPPN